MDIMDRIALTPVDIATTAIPVTKQMAVAVDVRRVTKASSALKVLYLLCNLFWFIYYQVKISVESLLILKITRKTNEITMHFLLFLFIIYLFIYVLFIHVLF